MRNSVEDVRLLRERQPVTGRVKTLEEGDNLVRNAVDDPPKQMASLAM